MFHKNRYESKNAQVKKQPNISNKKTKQKATNNLNKKSQTISSCNRILFQNLSLWWQIVNEINKIFLSFYLLYLIFELHSM